MVAWRRRITAFENQSLYCPDSRKEGEEETVAHGLSPPPPMT
jgi:hypothetical protein